MTKSELQQACEDNSVTISSVHLYVDYSGKDGDKFPRDKWACTISCDSKSETFEFFSGVGNRALRPGVKREGNRKYVVIGPSVADVLSCLLSDSDACETTFDDWCSNFGSNNDSLAALNTYLACQRNGTRVNRLLGYKLAKDLRGKEH